MTNKKTLKRAISFVVAIILVAMMIPVSYAAQAQVYDINGQRTALVAGFGKMNYEGKAYIAYKNLAEALTALGSEGGTLVFSGTQNLTGYTDIAGRKALKIVGVGTKPVSNVIVFGDEQSAFELGGDLYIDFSTIKASEEFAIVTNGYNFTAGKDFDTYYTIPDYTTGSRAYAPFVSLSAGNPNGTSAVSVSGGMFATVGVGSDSGTVGMNISGGTFEVAYAGFSNTKGGTLNGDVNFKLTGGTVYELVAGSFYDGTINGNVYVDITGGAVDKIYTGGKTISAKVNGNVVVSIRNAFYKNIGNPQNGSVSGKIIYTADREIGLKEDAYYNYYIVGDGGIATPVFDGINLLGFKFSDKNGCITEKVSVNGTPLVPVNGVFALPEGYSVVKIEPEIELSLNKYAKYVSGYEDGTFRPQNNLTRAEAITMLVRLVADENKIKGKATSRYADVKSGAWYESYIGLFETLGYLDTIAKVGGGEIGPDDKITRGEFVEIARHILRFINERNFEIKEFSDVPESHPYYNAIGEIGYLGIVGGYEDGTFKPDNLITRAEVVTIINRMLSKSLTGAQGGTVFADTNEHWAKDQIIMAANPANVGGVDIWTITGDVTKGKFELIEGTASVGQQIEKLYKLAKNGGSSLDVTDGIDEISNWQIDNIVNSSSDYSTITGKTYYISPNGDDKNDGLSPEKAWKSLSKTNSGEIMKGDGVLFERGATFRGKFTALPGVTYSAYGTGDKPRIYGSLMNYADPEMWEAVPKYENVWKLKKTLTEDVGVIIFNSSHEHGNYNEIAGTKFVAESITPEILKSDLQFFYYFGRTYVYSKGNPGERFDSIEIGTNGSLVKITGDDIVIDNLHFRYTGGHVVGTGNRKNITSKNCIYAYAGGSVLSGKTLYGNAFESYGGCDGWYAYNNWMYQIYDTGVTHQFTPTTGECIQKNVEYIGNVIEYCHWSIEYYNRDSTDGSARLCENIRIDDNICRMNGYGWGSRGRQGGSTMFCSANITKYTKNFTAAHNILDRSAGNIINIGSDGDKELVLNENIFVQNKGGSIGHLKTGYAACDDRVVKNLSGSTVEKEPVVIINNDTTVIDNIKKI